MLFSALNSKPHLLMKTSYKLLLLCLLPVRLWAGGNSPGMHRSVCRVPQEQNTVEKRKTIIKIYDVSNRDNLLVDNQFGQVTVNLWDRSEIRVQITITANASSDSKTQEYMDRVDIEEKRNGDQISLITHLEGSTSNWSLGKKNGENNYIHINYDVSMPKTNALTVRNKFGNTSIPMFQAPLTVMAKFGNFSATDLSGRQNDIDVSYGNADIRNLEQGKLDIAFSNLDLAKANVLELTNKFGKMNIGEVGRLNANISYSGAKIGTLRQSGKIKLSFSGGFRIDQMPKSADEVDINASYSSVTMPPMDDGDFDVTVSYGSFNHTLQNIRFTAQPSDNDRRGPQMTKQYAGQVGRGTGTKVHIVSKFGDVSFR